MINRHSILWHHLCPTSGSRLVSPSAGLVGLSMLRPVINLCLSLAILNMVFLQATWPLAQPIEKTKNLIMDYSDTRWRFGILDYKKHGSSVSELQSITHEHDRFSATQMDLQSAFSTSACYPTIQYRGEKWQRAIRLVSARRIRI